MTKQFVWTVAFAVMFLMAASPALAVASSGTPEARARPMPTTPAHDCNEKIHNAILTSVKDTCDGTYFDFYWSRDPVDTSPRTGVIAGAFSFRCLDGQRYLGLIKASVKTCRFSKPTISATSQAHLKN